MATEAGFHPPQKYILTKEQLTAFQSSKTYQDITTYIETLNNATVGVKLTDPCEESAVSASRQHHAYFSLKGLLTS